MLKCVNSRVTVEGHTNHNKFRNCELLPLPREMESTRLPEESRLAGVDDYKVIKKLGEEHAQ